MIDKAALSSHKYFLMLQKQIGFIPVSKPVISEKEISYVLDALQSGWVSSLGKYIDEFEKQFAIFCGVDHAIAVSNGTAALHLSLLGYGVGAGDEVIVPDFTFVATANAVKYVGAIPVFADIDEKTLCIDPEKIEKLITPKTKAIIPVHLFGHPADMTRINEIANKYNLVVIEDAAEAHGAKVNGKKVGSLGNCGTFSLYANKVITSGEGGFITTNDAELSKKLRLLLDHAMCKNKRYWHDMVGYNYRMTNLQAALGLAQLEQIDSFIRRRKEIFELYREQLSGIKNIKLNYKADWAEPNYWMVCLEFLDFNEEKRNAIMISLKEMNIDSRPFFYPLSDMPMYKGLTNTPVTHKVSARGINLPTFTSMENDSIKYICNAVHSLLKDS